MVSFPEITRSKLRKSLLAYFFAHKKEQFYLRELSCALKGDAGNLSKELANLERMGIFSSSKKGNLKYFRLNSDYPLYQELKSVVFKTIGVEASLRAIINADRGISLAFIYGSFAEGKENENSDIDLFIVGNSNGNKLMDAIDGLEKKLHREINYNIYPEKEFKRKLNKKDSFLVNIIKRPIVILKGSL